MARSASPSSPPSAPPAPRPSASHPGTPEFVDNLVAGWSAGFLVAAAFLVISGGIAASLVRVSKEDAAAALKEAGAAAG